MKKIELSEDELLVLSDWLNQFVSSDDFDELESPVKRVLADLDCSLEKENDYIFSNDYEEKLMQAKSKIKF